MNETPITLIKFIVDHTQYTYVIEFLPSLLYTYFTIEELLFSIKNLLVSYCFWCIIVKLF